MIPFLIKTFSRDIPCLASQFRGRRRWLASFPIVHVMTHQHLDLLLVALLYCWAFSGALLATTSLVLLAFLAGALLVTIALAVSDAHKLAAPTARVADEAAANLRLARALAVYAVLRAAVRVALVVWPRVTALASRVWRRADRWITYLQLGFGFAVYS